MIFKSIIWSIPPNAPLKSEYAVYMCFFDILASSYIMMCVERLSYIFLCRLNPSVVSLRMPCASAHGEPMFVMMDVHSLSMPFISAIDL